ncbi:MAG: hypothetical protein HY039_09070 [Nitrospirae bacterium]|nr:hypothetical protein [Nitrospirota bacterium]
MTESSLFNLFSPKIWSVMNRIRRRDRTTIVRIAVGSILALLFWLGAASITTRVLVHFRSAEIIGDLLAAKLLAMYWLVLFSVLLMSGLITALSTYFLAADLPLFLAAPVSISRLFYARLVETTALSSWMVFLFGLPVPVTYGRVYGAGLDYYLAMVPVFGSLILISVGVSVIFVHLLMRVFPARRTRDVLILLSLVGVLILYFLFRFLRPERLVNPETFATLTIFVAELGAPSSPWLPSVWAAETLIPLLTGKEGTPYFHLSLLISTAAAVAVIGETLARKVYAGGVSRAQEGRRIRLSGRPIVEKVLGRIAFAFPGGVGLVLAKDIRTFFRDTLQWSQLLLLAAIIVVYLYNYMVLPLDWIGAGGVWLMHLIAFLNLGLGGVVTAAVASRFLFPAVSQEGHAFWILRAAPVSLSRIVWGKFLGGLIPLTILGEILAVVSGVLLNVSTEMIVLSAVTMAFLSFAISGMAVGLGARYPDFRAGSIAHVQMGYGGMIFMLLSLALIVLVVFLLAWPTYRIVLAGEGWVPVGAGPGALILLAFGAAALVCTGSGLVSMRLGIKALAAGE